jgi:hypothetical protein
MNIVVCLKQVPEALKIAESGTALKAAVSRRRRRAA